jgi:hypothetical protein
MFLLWSWYSQHRRANAIRSFAERSGFHYLGTELPASLDLPDDPFANASRYWNVIDGEPNGIRIVAFDCRIGTGKGSWCRTVIAVQGSEGLTRSALSYSDLRAEPSNSWTILYVPHGIQPLGTGFMAVSELESRLSVIHATSH